MSEETELSKEVWHKTKGISITVILLLVINIVSTVWWAATLTSDVQGLKNRGEQYSIVIPELTERIIVLEAVTSEYQNVLTRLVAILDKVEDNINKIDREQAKRTNSIHTHKYMDRTK